MSGVIRQSAGRCWVVHDHRGEYDDGDRISHFDKEAQAAEYLDELVRFHRSTELHVVENQAPCFIAVAVCGYVYDKDGEGIEHYPDADSLAEVLRSVDWSTTADGRWLCSADADCEVCRSLRFREGEVE